MAARVDPRHVRARHQSMHHFIANAPWDAAAVLRVARDWVLAAMVRHGPVAAWIVDDTGFPKKGQHSVGVARQYCGVLGKQDNCQVAVSVSVANDAVSLPVAYQLYLPESWARDRQRRRAGACRRLSRSSRSGRSRSSRSRGAGRGRAARARRRRCRLWRHDRVSRRAHDRGRAVCGRRQSRRPRCGRRARPRGPRSAGGPRPAADARAAHRDASPAEPRALASALPPTAWRTVTWREGTRGGDALPLRARCACGPPIATSSARRRGRKSGC